MFQTAQRTAQRIFWNAINEIRRTFVSADIKIVKRTIEEIQSEFDVWGIQLKMAFFEKMILNRSERIHSLSPAHQQEVEGQLGKLGSVLNTNNTRSYASLLEGFRRYLERKMIDKIGNLEKGDFAMLMKLFRRGIFLFPTAVETPERAARAYGSQRRKIGEREASTEVPSERLSHQRRLFPPSLYGYAVANPGKPALNPNATAPDQTRRVRAKH